MKALADILLHYLNNQEPDIYAKVYERTQDAVLCFEGGRELNRQYWEKLVTKVVTRVGCKMFVPYPLRAGMEYIVAQGISTTINGKKEVIYQLKRTVSAIAKKVGIAISDGTEIVTLAMV